MQGRRGWRAVGHDGLGTLRSLRCNNREDAHEARIGAPGIVYAACRAAQGEDGRAWRVAGRHAGGHGIHTAGGGPASLGERQESAAGIKHSKQERKTEEQAGHETMRQRQCQVQRHMSVRQSAGQNARGAENGRRA